MPDTANPVDLTNCDREPIHQLGGIQPIGFLLAMSRDWVIERASANVGDFVGRSVEQVLGLQLTDLFLPEALHTLRNRASSLIFEDAVERAFGCILQEGGRRFDVAVHMSGNRIIFEAEPSSDIQGDATGIVRSMITRLERTDSMDDFLDEGARIIRGLTGYDRVMVYRFAPDGSGEVAAESCRPMIGSFKGLHYPATDIPTQARALYKRNLLRVITDINAEPVPIVPQLDSAGQPIDLSLSILRSVSRIHIEYLKNMGVGASMSISIIVDDELWGLFACHHYSAHSPSFHARSVCELFAQLFALQLESRERKATAQFERRARELSADLLGEVVSDQTLLNDPDWLRELLTRAIPADGVGIWMNEDAAFSGQAPPLEDFRRIIAVLNEQPAAHVMATDCIATMVPDAERFAGEAAGLLAIPISRTTRDYVVLFRQEIIRSVRWGGDPHKPVEYGPNGPRLTPRESFEEWKETVEGHSRPFMPSELRVAETLRGTLSEVVLRMADEAAAQRQQANERQELLIAELNHRVRNILGVIRGLIRQSKPHDNDLETFLKLIDGRIHSLARAHNQITEDHWGPAPLRKLVDAEAAVYLADRPDRIRVTGGNLLLNPQAYSTMALVLHELITNSTKYGSLSDSGTVDINWARDAAGDLIIDWREKDGPAVIKPTRKGFGTTIIERSVPYDLGGKVAVDYAASGFVAQFRIPAKHVSEAGQEPAAPALKEKSINQSSHSQAAPDKFLAGHTMLLVEDSIIIALDAEDVLERLGARVLPAASVAAAMELLDQVTPTLAMLDINLGDSTSYPVADALAERNIPFIFASGYGEQAQLPEQHRGRTVLQKPYTLENVTRAIEKLLQGEA